MRCDFTTTETAGTTVEVSWNIRREGAKKQTKVDIYIYVWKRKKQAISCEIEDSIETHGICEPCVIRTVIARTADLVLSLEPSIYLVCCTPRIEWIKVWLLYVCASWHAYCRR